MKYWPQMKSCKLWLGLNIDLNLFLGTRSVCHMWSLYVPNYVKICQNWNHVKGQKLNCKIMLLLGWVLNKMKSKHALPMTYLCSTIYCNRTWTRGLIWINAYHTTHCRLIDLNLNLQYHTSNRPYTTYFMCFIQLRWTIHDAQSLTLCDPYLIAKG